MRINPTNPDDSRRVRLVPRSFSMHLGIYRRPTRLALLMVLGCLVACGSGSANDATAADSGSSAQGTPAATAGAGETHSEATKAHPSVVGMGATVNLASHLVPGDFTVFDFTSKYCPPCQKISPYLDKLHAGRDGVSVVKVDINRPDKRGIDWQSPTARQFQLTSIPHFKLYDAEGNFVSEGTEAWDTVVSWIMELEQPAGR
jgi:thiol-disulfide isomerase/thioredoxin